MRQAQRRSTYLDSTPDSKRFKNRLSLNDFEDFDDEEDFEPLWSSDDAEDD